MLNFLLEILPQRPDGSYDGNYYFSDRFGEPVIYALIGFLIVFIGIAIIITIIWLIGLLMRKTDNLAFIHKIGKNKKKKTKETGERALQSDEIPDEVKAAVVAAIMAYYSEARPECEFKVKRIKRI